MQNKDPQSHAAKKDEAAAAIRPRPPHPFVQASFLSKLLFIWPYRFMNEKNRVRDANGEGGIERAVIEDADLPE